MIRKAMNRAEICIIEGEQGAGKTNTAVAKVVDAYHKNPNTKIFTSFHLYGIRYVYADLTTIIEYLNSHLMEVTEGEEVYVVIDEAYIGSDARMGMALTTRMLTWFGMQIRKRGIHIVLIVQHGRMIDVRWRLVMTEHILCSYNEKTRKIKLTVVERHNKKKEYSYYAPQYWKYYDTNELPQIPENLLAKALIGAR